ncbi:MAG: OadG family protein [Lachnospiraceae bacterium]|nr:OadG family protein [Lachnospiraceae bacterium]
MTNFKKKLALVSCAFALVLSMTACGKAVKNIEYDESTVTSRAESIVQAYQTLDASGKAEEVINYDDAHVKLIDNSTNGVISGTAYKSGLESFENALENIGGELALTDEVTIKSDDEEITADAAFKGSNGKTGKMEIIMTSTYEVTDVVFNVDKTFAEKMENAALNTVLGMGTTFCVLILIAIIIALLPYIVAPFTGTKKKAAPAEAPKKAPAPAPAAAPEPAEDLTDDQELVAVIAAAVAAYESEATGTPVSPDTFVVRSLRRR